MERMWKKRACSNISSCPEIGMDKFVQSQELAINIRNPPAEI